MNLLEMFAWKWMFNPNLAGITFSKGTHMFASYPIAILHGQTGQENGQLPMLRLQDFRKVAPLQTFRKATHHLRSVHRASRAALQNRLEPRFNPPPGTRPQVPG